VTGIRFAFCLHSHQPPGNLRENFENAYHHAYRPFLELLRRHPQMKVVLHYSGALLSWLQANHPRFLGMIGRFVARGQVEVMTGGYYEPILPMLPERDQIGQITKLTHRLEGLFNTRPKGLWLTERIWEPALAGPLSRGGVRYTLVDDNNFQRAGIAGEHSLGHFTARSPTGESIEVFPISSGLRRAIPFESPEAVLDLLRSLAGEGDRLVLFADDGEKLGDWPGTHQRVYEQGWLDRFFRLLASNRDWVHVTTLGEFVEQVAPLGPVDLPAGSYAEMMEWSGGSWRNFLSRYLESNLMYRKMLRVSDAVAGMAGSEQQEQARDHLYRGQANDPYWHGVFGGIYLLHLRTGGHRSLQSAENLAAPGDGLRIEETDLDGDGQEEALATSKTLNCYLHRTGGQIFELDHRPTPWNLLATLTRRRERYHDQAGDGAFDWYPRRALIDHFLRDDTSVEGFARCQYGEQGDFVNQPYSISIERRRAGANLIMRRDGGVWVSECFLPITVTKRLGLTEGSPEINVEYCLQHSGREVLPLWFATESSFVLSSGNAPGRHYQISSLQTSPPLDATAAYAGISEFGLVDECLRCRVRLQFGEPTTLWTFPILTLSHTLEGLKRSYQGSCVTAHWRIELRPDQPWCTSFRISLETIPSAAQEQESAAPQGDAPPVGSLEL